MLIEAYFQEIQQLLASTPLVQSFHITFDKRSPHIGFLRGEIYFIDNSILHLREFVDVEITINRYMYVYQYMNSGKKFAFRYDDTGHHKELNLPTYPHHKHDRFEDHIISSQAPALIEILDEIEKIVKF